MTLDSYSHDKLTSVLPKFHPVDHIFPLLRILFFFRFSDTMFSCLLCFARQFSFWPPSLTPLPHCPLNVNFLGASLQGKERVGDKEEMYNSGRVVVVTAGL